MNAFDLKDHELTVSEVHRNLPLTMLPRILCAQTLALVLFQ
jgi:hypothetical protein